MDRTGLLSHTLVYACRISNEDDLMSSSSGGAFTAFSDYFLGNGDAVACSKYDYETHQQVFFITDNKAERDKARGSIYFQSSPGEIFNKIENFLKEYPQKKLLFVGMGCQSAAMVKFAEIQGFRDRLTVLDIICYGVVSPLLWKEYALSLEKEFGKILSVRFRDKRTGWRKSTPIADTKDKEVSLREYMKVFFGHKAIRPSCYQCPYTKTERYTDVTIGDYWGIQDKLPDFYSEKGNSLVLIHTKKGKELFESIKPTIEWRQSNTEDCRQIALERPNICDNGRRKFWKDYYKHGASYVIKKYGNDTFWKKVNTIIKNRTFFSVLRQRLVSIFAKQMKTDERRG